jgi:hypothetical protein
MSCTACHRLFSGWVASMVSRLQLSLTARYKVSFLSPAGKDVRRLCLLQCGKPDGGQQHAHQRPRSATRQHSVELLGAREYQSSDGFCLGRLVLLRPLNASGCTLSEASPIGAYVGTLHSLLPLALIGQALRVAAVMFVFASAGVWLRV